MQLFQYNYTEKTILKRFLLFLFANGNKFLEFDVKHYEWYSGKHFLYKFKYVMARAGVVQGKKNKKKLMHRFSSTASS